MYTGNDAAMRARWEVLWVKDGRLHRVGTGEDLYEALRIYTLAVKSPGRKAVTLRCANLGFPPPRKLQPRVIKFNPPKRSRRTGELVYEARVTPMEKMNRDGIWWCPFCIKLRRFKYERGWWTQERAWMAQPRMVCPTCGVDHNSFDVRKWNPRASMLFHSDKVRNPDRPVRTRRRRRTKSEED